MARRLLSSVVAVMLVAGCGLGVGTVEEDGRDSAASELTDFEGNYRLQIDRNEAMTIEGMRRFHQQAGACLSQSSAECLEASFAATLGPAVEVAVANPGSTSVPLEGQPVTGNKWGYAFRLTRHPSPDGGFAWGLDGDPIVYKRTGIKSFYIDETGILLGADQGVVVSDAGMPEI